MGLEKIFDWFIKNFIFTEKKIKALERHAAEEFKNLEKISVRKDLRENHERRILFIHKEVV